MTESSQTGEFAVTAVYAEMCLSSLVTQRLLDEFCCSATFLDLSLSLLTAASMPPPLFHSFTVPSSLPYVSQHADWGVSFSCVRRPRQCDSSLSACLIRNSQLGLESSRRGDWRSALLNPRTVRSALLTPVNHIIIWLDLITTHTLICTPRLQLIHVHTEMQYFPLFLQVQCTQSFDLFLKLSALTQLINALPCRTVISHELI